MSFEKEISESNLQEMARVILSEIYRGGKPRNRQNETDCTEFLSPTASLAESGGGELDRRTFVYDDERTTQRKPDKSGDFAGFLPRLNRGEFFEQRIQRRRLRQESNSSFDNSSAPAENYSINVSDNLAALNLSEKLSDSFCRDARRYDGAFERY